MPSSVQRACGSRSRLHAHGSTRMTAPGQTVFFDDELAPIIDALRAEVRTRPFLLDSRHTPTCWCGTRLTLHNHARALMHDSCTMRSPAHDHPLAKDSLATCITSLMICTAVVPHGHTAVGASVAVGPPHSRCAGSSACAVIIVIACTNPLHAGRWRRCALCRSL